MDNVIRIYCLLEKRGGRLAEKRTLTLSITLIGKWPWNDIWLRVNCWLIYIWILFLSRLLLSLWFWLLLLLLLSCWLLWCCLEFPRGASLCILRSVSFNQCFRIWLLYLVLGDCISFLGDSHSLTASSQCFVLLCGAFIWGIRVTYIYCYV